MYILKELEEAFIDVLDGNTWEDIQSFTGLDEKRCRELKELFNKVLNKFNKNEETTEHI